MIGHPAIAEWAAGNVTDTDLLWELEAKGVNEAVSEKLGEAVCGDALGDALVFALASVPAVDAVEKALNGGALTCWERDALAHVLPMLKTIRDKREAMTWEVLA